MSTFGTDLTERKGRFRGCSASRSVDPVADAGGVLDDRWLSEFSSESCDCDFGGVAEWVDVLVPDLLEQLLGQFLSVDPLDAQTQQAYEYAGDDPVDFTDPSGLIFGIPGTRSWSQLGEVAANFGAGIANSGAMTVNGIVSLATLGQYDPNLAVEPAYACAGGYTEGEVAGFGLQIAAGGAALDALDPLGIAGAEDADAGTYLAGKAPTQVSPGTTSLDGQYVNDLGRVEPWTAHYDEYGRLVGRTDYNAGNEAQGIPDTHYHTMSTDPATATGWKPGHISQGSISHDRHAR